MSIPSYYRNEKYETPFSYAVMHKNFDIRMKSRSGGVFTALSDYILHRNGVIYGCVLDEHFLAIHIRSDNTVGRNRMRGSKYIQSDMGDVFLLVKKDLEEGRSVLFSGTSCQVAGLYAFLGKQYNNLLTVDIVCHGVPSPIVWKKYLQWHEQKAKKRILSVDFRNKLDFGWKAHIETLYFEDGTRVSSRVFCRLFYGHTILRPCCYSCPYKDMIHPGNITIADYWGIENAAPGLNDDKGVSLVLINDEKGNDYFHFVNKDLKIHETRIEDSIQPPLVAPYPEPKNRTAMWIDFWGCSFKQYIQKYAGYGFIASVKRKVQILIKKTLGNLSLHL